jgi:membrane protease YdiL (CAAX protease family)
MLLSPHAAFLEALPKIGLKSILKRLLVVFIIGIFLSLISVIIITVGFKIEEPKQSNLEYLLLFSAQHIPLFLTTLFLFYKGIPKKNVLSQLRSKITNKSVWLIGLALLINLILGILLILYSFTYGVRTDIASYQWLTQYINAGESKITLEYLMKISTSLFIFISIAFIEEFIFRFTLYRFFRSKGLLLALLISSGVFAFFHGNAFLDAFIFGVVIALYYEYTNNFFGAVIIHTLTNQFIVFYSYYLAALYLL